MADLVVALPEPHPEDDEDVVWGLSTASALWARGERRDALVWLRRAVEAADAAGQAFRASELGMCVAALEEALAAATPATRHDVADTVTDDDALLAEDTLSEEVTLGAQRRIIVGFDFDGLEPASAPRPVQEAAHYPTAPGHDVAPSPYGPSSTFPQPPQAASPQQPAYPQQPSITPPYQQQPYPSTQAPVFKSAAAPGAAAQILPASVRPPPDALLAPAVRPPSGRPAARPAPSERENEPTPVPPPPMVPAAPPAAPSRPPPRVATAIGVVPSPGGTLPPTLNEERTAEHLPSPTLAAKSAARAGGRTRPRGPILDPWAEEPSPTSLRAPEEIVSQRGNEYLITRRPLGSEDEDDDVLTSAASVDTTLGKKKPPGSRGQPPPVPHARSKATGQEPPGHIAGGASGVSSKRPADVADRSAGSASRAPQAGPLLPEALPSPGAEPAAAAAQVSRDATPPAATPPAEQAEDPAPPQATPPAQQKAPPAGSIQAPLKATRPPAQAVAPSTSPGMDEAATVTEAPEDALPYATCFRGSDLAEIDAFADLSEEMQEDLVRIAHVDVLGADEEVAGFGAALMLEGTASVCTTIVDTPIHHAKARTLVTSRGTLAEGVPLRVVAGSRGARVAVWDQKTIDEALQSCPWVVEELRAVADRMQACAGATIGPLGDLDEATLRSMLGRLTLRCLQPDEPLVIKGHPMPGLVVVGGGALEQFKGDGGDEGTPRASATARPGDLLFAGALLRDQPAPATARATSGGALLLVGEHSVLRELFEEAPALVAILKGNA